MDILGVQHLLALGSGGIVGFTLGLIGGGGSILAVPLLLYVVGEHDPHRVIGTSALAVSINAFANLWPHARAGNVHWSAAGIFAAFGVAGAAVGSTLGKEFDGKRLIFLFALLMIVVALLMLRPRRVVGESGAPLTRQSVARLAVVGLGAGALSGFFGIGGGFLIVPGLVVAAALPMLEAVGSSLVAVGAFGLTTSVNYALSGLVDWGIAAIFILGGIGGGWLGAAAAARLAVNRQRLSQVFAAVVLIVAFYMIYRSLW